MRKWIKLDSARGGLACALLLDEAQRFCLTAAFVACQLVVSPTEWTKLVKMHCMVMWNYEELCLISRTSGSGMVFEADAVSGFLRLHCHSIATSVDRPFRTFSDIARQHCQPLAPTRRLAIVVLCGGRFLLNCNWSVSMQFLVTAQLRPRRRSVMDGYDEPQLERLAHLNQLQ